MEVLCVSNSTIYVHIDCGFLYDSKFYYCIGYYSFSIVECLWYRASLRYADLMHGDWVVEGVVDDEVVLYCLNNKLGELV